MLSSMINSCKSVNVAKCLFEIVRWTLLVVESCVDGRDVNIQLINCKSVHQVESFDTGNVACFYRCCNISDNLTSCCTLPFPCG